MPEIARGQLELPVNNVCLVGNVIQSPKAVTPLEKKKPGRKAGKEVMAKPANTIVAAVPVSWVMSGKQQAVKANPADTTIVKVVHV